MLRQLPVRSPLSFSALLKGVAGALGSDGTNELTALLRSHFGSADVILTDSGTSALTLALASVALDGDALVAMPAYACYDLATAAEGADARVVLYDVDPLTLAPQAESFARAMSRRPSAVVIVHLYGVPVDLSRMRQQIDEAGATVVDDAAQGIGGELAGRPLGAHGDLGVLSFGRGKGITGGGGGALLISDAAAAHRPKRVAGSNPAGWGQVTKASAQWLLARPAPFALLSALPFLEFGETIYHSPREPRALSRASQKIVRQVWSESLAAAEVRRVNAGRLARIAEASGHWQIVQAPTGSKPGWLRLPLLAKAERASLKPSSNLGVMPGYPKTLYQLERFQSRCVLDPSDAFPGAETLAARLITVPTHDRLGERDLDRLEAWLQSPA